MSYCAQAFLGIGTSPAEKSAFLQSAAPPIFFLISLKLPGRGGKRRGEERRGKKSKSGVARLLLIFLHFPTADAHLKYHDSSPISFGPQ